MTASLYGITELAREHRCETCGADVDARCVSPKGKPTNNHRARESHLYAAFRLGRDVGEESAVRCLLDEGFASWRAKWGDSWVADVWGPDGRAGEAPPIVLT